MKWGGRWVILASLCVAGCGSDPYPEAFQFEPTRPPGPRVPEPAFILDVPPVMYFKEKKKGEYVIRAAVPAPGVAQISVQDLPSKAVFDPKTLKLTWTPGPRDGDDPKTRPYVVKFTLQSSRDPITVYEATTVLLVLEKSARDASPEEESVPEDDRE